jgi:hypothetical protein
LNSFARSAGKLNFAQDTVSGDAGRANIHHPRKLDVAEAGANQILS